MLILSANLLFLLNVVQFAIIMMIVPEIQLYLWFFSLSQYCMDRRDLFFSYMFLLLYSIIHI